MFWDSSAVVPLLVSEERSAELAPLLPEAGSPTVWWSTGVECLSALYRRQREAPLAVPLLTEALRRLEALLESFDTVPPTEAVRRRAARLLATHVLRAADALQLGAALVWCEERPSGETFVCLDTRLREAARREGFEVLPPG